MKNIILLCCAYFLSIAMHAQGIINTVAGGGLGGDGSLAVNAYIEAPNDVYVDDTGNIYIATNYTIRKVTAATGIISTLAGDGNGGVGCDGCDATQARFWGALAIAFDKQGNYYIADKANHAIRKVDAATNIITIVAGNWTPGYSGDGGPATSAQLSNPVDICFDTAGNMYIACKDYVIRKVDAQTGNISTVAGDGTQGTWSNGDVAVNAQLGELRGMCVEQAGNIYFADGDNRKIGKINTSGILATYCGTGTFGTSGDGGLAINAQVACPTKMKTYKGSLYFAEFCYNVIRKIEFSTNIINTVAGNQSSGFSGDGGPAIQAELDGPLGICFDTTNDMFIADGLNYRIRKVSQVTGINSIAQSQFQLYPNPSSGIFQVQCNDEIKSIQIFNATGNKISYLNINSREAIVDISFQPDGIYVMNLISDKGIVSKKMVVHH